MGDTIGVSEGRVLSAGLNNLLSTSRRIKKSRKNALGWCLETILPDLIDSSLVFFAFSKNFSSAEVHL